MSALFDKSIIIPIYENEMNIIDLLDALEGLMGNISGTCEVIFVVDGSKDRSWEILNKELPRRNLVARLISHSRNFGSFAAIRTGMDASRGQNMAVISADLQEPPELLIDLFRVLDSDEADIAIGRRVGRNDGLLSTAMSNIFWSMFRRFVFSDIPKGGVDVFACNSKVCQTLLRLQESNSSLIAQLFWVGYRRAFVPYERRERQKGKSSWTFMRKVRYLLDSMISFSDLPLQIILWLGMLGIAFSSVLGCVIFFSRIFGLITVPGYTVVMLAILFGISLFLFLNGMLGLYLWRIFENTKKRPLSVVNDTRDFDKE